MDRPTFSVLDLAPVAGGAGSADALRNSVELARVTERLGYHRYWVAEHHGMPGIAASSPAVLAAHIADATSTVRVGAGGVMLPNHPPLVVAEQFGMLEALHPGRIDLGIGRAPGTDPMTARALRREAEPVSPEDFFRQIVELMGLFDGSLPPEHPYARIFPVPAPGNVPGFWVLGSSAFSAGVAADLGLPFAFAHHLGAANLLPALAAYRSRYQPSQWLDRPYVLVAVSGLCAGTDEEARFLAAPWKLALLQLRQGRPSTVPSPESAARYDYNDAEREYVKGLPEIVGGPDRFRTELDALIEAAHPDEVMVTTATHRAPDRVRSYELIAGLYGLRPQVEEPKT
ncbi:MAG: LLM class flavin-dependent oxidoreductase [Candidatus Dormibacteraeota bacterium]|nr:LLM class flavin-dependent oxidoreductase [Candidatus Dormibacteraeota bacterium]